MTRPPSRMRATMAARAYQPAADPPLAHQHFGTAHRELRARRAAPAPERRDDLPERRRAPRSAAAAVRAARRGDRRALRRGRRRQRRRCTTAPGRWRRSKSASRSCVPRARAATSRSRIRSRRHEPRPAPQPSCATGARRCRTIVWRIWSRTRRARWCARCRCGSPRTRSRSATGPSCASSGRATASPSAN